jgi:hypothetical protein
MDKEELLKRITVDPALFGGKPVIRGRRLAVKHVLALLTASGCVGWKPRGSARPSGEEDATGGVTSAAFLPADLNLDGFQRAAE